MAEELFVENIIPQKTFQQILEENNVGFEELGNTGLSAKGINLKKADGTNIFSVLTTGVDIGDIIIGNYTGGQGIKWDQSANTTTFTGTISGSTITGGTIQTASSGKRIVMTSGAMKTYDASGNVTFDLDSNSSTQVLTLYTPTADTRLGLNLHIDGTGTPLLVQSDNTSNTSTLISVISAGTGVGLSLDLNNASSTSHAILIANSGTGADIGFSSERNTLLISEIGSSNGINDIISIRKQLWVCQTGGTPGHWLPLDARGFKYTTAFDSLDGFYQSTSNGATITLDSSAILNLKETAGGGHLYFRKNISNSKILDWSKPRYARFDVKFSSVDYNQSWGFGMGVPELNDYNSAQTTLPVGCFFCAYRKGATTNWTLSAVASYDGSHHGVVVIGDDYFTAGTLYTCEILVLPRDSGGAGDAGQTLFRINGTLVATIGNPVAYPFSGNEQYVMAVEGVTTNTTNETLYLPYWEFYQAY